MDLHLGSSGKKNLEKVEGNKSDFWTVLSLQPAAEYEPREAHPQLRCHLEEPDSRQQLDLGEAPKILGRSSYNL